jgi:hypothetical protein
MQLRLCCPIRSFGAAADTVVRSKSEGRISTVTRKEHVVARKISFKTAAAIVKKQQEPAPPLPNENGGVSGQKRPAKQQPPTKEEVRAWVRELNDGLTGNDAKTVEEATRLCRGLALRAVERLGLIITGIQAATPPPVVMSSITVLKGANVISKGDVGVTAETTE